MDPELDLTSYAHAFGGAQAAWRFASAELRRASALATVSAAWDVFRRDAGAGDVGPAHEATAVQAQLPFTKDLRRDAVILWLADHAVPPVAEAAAILAHMVGAARRFGAEDQALLDTARNVLTHPAKALWPIGRMIASQRGMARAVQPLQGLATAVDHLRENAGFLEGEGSEVHLTLPGGVINHYVAAEPGGCWAFNLALLAQDSQAAGAPPPPGLASRVLFRSDLEPEEIAVCLVDDASAAWRGAYDRLLRLEPELARGRDALAHLSRNARARDAWLLVAALGACTRTQLARALGLSRAGADIQARALGDAGLVTLAAGGQIAGTRQRPAEPVTAPLDQGLLSDAVSDLDASLAEINRLLARARAIQPR